MVWRRGKLAVFILISEAVFIVLFAILVKYGDDAHANPKREEEMAHSRRRRQIMDDTTTENSANGMSDMDATSMTSMRNGGVMDTTTMDDMDHDDDEKGSEPKTNSLQLLYPSK